MRARLKFSRPSSISDRPEAKAREEPIDFDMERVDRHVITPEEYEEAPEISREMAERGDLYIGEKLIRRGRPPKDKPKIAISIRLSEDVLNAFKRCGPGWQTRIDEALAEWLKEHPETKPLTAPAPSDRGE